MTTPSPTPQSGAAPLAVRMANISKRFGTVHANRDVTLEVRQAEIHALVGENGAGKSTLMHMLSGLHAPTSGTVEVFGRDVTGWSTDEAIAAGVGMVHQHFMLVPTLTVAENLVLGREPTRGVTIDSARAIEDVRQLCADTGLTVDPTRLVADLSVGEAQRVEILKVLYRGAKVLVLDEPTAVLSPPEVQELWTVLRRLRAQGSTILIITHKLDEVMTISDTVTVMRQGRSINAMPTASTSAHALAREMVGRDVVLAGLEGVGLESATGPVSPNGAAAPPGLPRSKVNSDTPVLDVAALVVHSDRGTTAVDALSFAVRAGEIFGIAGVEGNGQTELLDAIAGLRRVEQGAIRLNGTPVHDRSVRARRDAGISHIPEDRHRRGLILDHSISENLLLGQHDQFASRIGLDRVKMARHADAQIAAFDIRPTTRETPARALSGGNQQKVVIAREMGRTFSLLLAAQPTRGVDVGAIEFIHAQLRAARASGKAVLLVSADLAEVLALADRVAVMYEGRFVCVRPAQECTPELLGPYMTGAARDGDA